VIEGISGELTFVAVGSVVLAVLLWIMWRVISDREE
jgi:HAMP domain-containing protein